jgi:hypothetical protein
MKFPQNVEDAFKEMDTHNRELVQRYLEGYISKKEAEKNMIDNVDYVISELPQVEDDSDKDS